MSAAELPSSPDWGGGISAQCSAGPLFC